MHLSIVSAQHRQGKQFYVGAVGPSGPGALGACRGPISSSTADIAPVDSTLRTQRSKLLECSNPRIPLDTLPAVAFWQVVVLALALSQAPIAFWLGMLPRR